ncbi:hypothetical protein GF338_00455, partial [candidate division WOR-3 bacterium]|nr:hypothetical protein [candidate division WOR-3 bacterium]
VDGEGRVWCVWVSNRGGEDKWDYSVWASYTKASGVEEPITPATPQPIFTVDKGIGSSFTFRVSNPSTSGILQIYSSSGRLVNRLTVHASGEIVWDGCGFKGKRLSAGVYFARLNKTDTPSLKIVLTR